MDATQLIKDLQAVVDRVGNHPVRVWDGSKITTVIHVTTSDENGMCNPVDSNVAHIDLI